MNKRRLSCALVPLVMLGTFATSLVVLPGPVGAITLYVGGTGMGNYTTIQSAIENAAAGDIVYVFNGTYIENLEISKPIDLTGEDRLSTVVSGIGSNLPVIKVISDWVSISGFNISFAGWNDGGVQYFGQENFTLRDCVLSNNDIGVRIGWGSNITIERNIFLSNGMDIEFNSVGYSSIIDNDLNSGGTHNILIESSTKITISNNRVSNGTIGLSMISSESSDIINNSFSGDSTITDLDDSANMTISNNSMSGKGIYLEGKYLHHWNTHRIEPSNTVKGRPIVYWKNMTGGTVPAGAGQVMLANSTGVTVEYQNLDDVAIGIELGFSPGNFISNNTVYRCSFDGIFLHESSGNVVRDNNASWNGRAGISLESSDNNTISANDAIENLAGVYLLFSNGNSISGNELHSNTYGVNLFTNNDDNLINGNDAQHNSFGVYVLGSFRGWISQNHLSNNINGLYVVSSDGIVVFGNIAVNNDENGIWISNTENSSVELNEMSSNQLNGLYMVWSRQNFIFANKAYLNGERGMYLESSENNTVFMMDIQSSGFEGLKTLESHENRIIGNDLLSNGRDGLKLEDSNDNIVDDNSASLNSGRGAYLIRSHGNIITNQTVLSNGIYGLSLYQSKNNTVRDNHIQNHSGGIQLYESTGNNVVEKNSVVNNSYYGISVSSTKGARFSGNVLVNNGFHFSGEHVEDWNSHSIDTSNTVNGDPVQYWSNAIGGTIPSGAGQVILANCTDVAVENQNVTNNSFGIQIAFSSAIRLENVSTSLGWGGILFYFVNHSAIVRSQVFNTRFGIRLHHSHHNLIDGTGASHNEEGIYLRDSNNNLISNNTAILNSRMGFKLMTAYENILVGNTASNNLGDGFWVYGGVQNLMSGNTAFNNSAHGFSLQGCTDNKVINNHISHNLGYGLLTSFCSDTLIFHNNFIDNTYQSQDNFSAWGSTYDNGYPSGGNYWSNYTGSDIYSGPNQDQPGSDGIGDIPYIIPRFPSGVREDRYPLMNPITPVPVYLPSTPRNFEVTAGDEKAMLTWDYPAFDGDSPILGYRIWRMHGGVGVVHAEVGSVLNFTDTGLVNGEEYRYWVHAFNMVGESPSTEWLSVIPSSPPPNESPECSITYPTSETELSGLVTVTGTSTDQDGPVLKVEVKIDDGVWEEANGTSSWVYEWNTSAMLDGNHTISARAFDGENYSTIVSISVVVDNYIPPPEEPKDDSIWIVTVAVAVVIAIVLSILYLLLRRKKRKIEMDENLEIEEESSE